MNYPTYWPTYRLFKRPGLFALPLALAAIAAPGFAFAQTSPVSPTGSNFIAGSSVPWVPMAEWETPNKTVSSAAGDQEISKAPVEATKYQSKTFTFPTGSIRILEFKKSDGGVLHEITFETELYVVKGSAEVQVLGKTVTLGAGDAVNLPSGILRSKAKAPEDTTVVLFTVGSMAPAPVASVVYAKDAKENSRPPNPGEPAVTVKFYTFDGNSIRVATNKAPGKSGIVEPKTDAILYMLSGHMQNTVGTEVMHAHAGDALREQAGLGTHWDVFEDSVFIATSAPFNPQPIAASAAK